MRQPQRRQAITGIWQRNVVLADFLVAAAVAVDAATAIEVGLVDDALVDRLQAGRRGVPG